MSPAEVYITQKTKEKRKQKNIPSFEAGDSVRVLRNRATFAKGSDPQWTKTVYKGLRKQGNSYLLENRKGALPPQYRKAVPGDTVSVRRSGRSIAAERAILNRAPNVRRSARLNP